MRHKQHGSFPWQCGRDWFWLHVHDFENVSNTDRSTTLYHYYTIITTILAVNMYKLTISGKKEKKRNTTDHIPRACPNDT